MDGRRNLWVKPRRYAQKSVAVRELWDIFIEVWGIKRWTEYIPASACRCKQFKVIASSYLRSMMMATATVIVAVAAAMTHAQADATEAAEGDVCLPPPQDANASARSARLRS